MPSSNSHSDAVLELAEEFLDRYRRGERPALGEYLERHPELANEIREVFPAMAMLENIAIDEETLAVDKTPPDAATAAPVLKQLGDYRIVREVGRGGMGIVYEAEQLSLGRHVALKVMPQTTLLDANQKRRFDREARAAAKLHHTNIVPVFGIGEADGIHYYVMQFIQGLGLDEVIAEVKRMQDAQPSGSSTSPTSPAGELKISRRHDMPAEQVARSLMTGGFDRSGLGEGEFPDSPASGQWMTETVDLPNLRSQSGSSASGSGRLSDVFSVSPSAMSMPGSAGSQSSRARRHTYWHGVARIGAQVGNALQYAHDQGILHRDIKPSNLLLDLRGTVWVTDFGLAKASDQQDITHTGDILGTLRYMPPEAFDGRSDARSDLYSLGLTLYELLALRPAFVDKDRRSLVKHVTTESAPRLERINPAIPRDLVTIVHKAIDRDPGHRYRTAGDLAADLQRFLDDEPIKARRTALVERFLRWSRRNKVVASLGAVLTAVLVVAAIASSVAAVRFRNLANEKERERVKASAAREVAQRSAYVAQINLAQQAAETRAGSRRVDALLDKWTYRPGETDLRGWEWFYLRAGRDESSLTVPLPDPEYGAAWNPARPLIAAAMGGGVRLVDAVTGTEVHRFTGRRIRVQSGWVDCLAWSPEGTRIAAGSHDSTVRVWDVDTRLELFVLDAPGGPVADVLWSPGGRRLAARRGNRVDIWDLREKLSHVRLPLEANPKEISWRSENELTVLSAGGAIDTWDVVAGGTLGGSLPEALGRGTLVDIAWNPDGTRLAVGYTDGTFGLWEASRPEVPRYLSPGRVTLSLQSLAWCPHGERVAGIRDGSVHVFDVGSAGSPAGPTLARTFKSRRAVERVSWSPDGQRLVTQSSVDRSLRIFDLDDDSRPDVVFRAAPSSVGRVAWSPDGNLLAARVQEAAGEAEALVRIFDGRSGKPLRDLPALAKRDVLAWHPDGRRLAIPDGSGILVWDARTGETLATLRTTRWIPYCLAWSADGRRLASGHRGGTVAISDVASGVEIRALAGHEGQSSRDYVRSLAWSSDDRWLASVAENGTVNIWDVEASRRTAALQVGTQYEVTSPISAVEWSPDGARLAVTSMSTSAQGMIWVWNVVDGEAKDPLILRSPSAVRDLAWHPDGRRLASAGWDRTIKVWDVEVLPGETRDDSRRRSHELVTLHGHTAAVRSLSWNPLRPVLVSSSEDGTIRLWDASPGYALDRSPLSLAQIDPKPAIEGRTVANLRWSGETHAFLGQWDEAARDFEAAARLESGGSDELKSFLTPWWVAGFYGGDLSVPAPPERHTDPWSPIPGNDGTAESWRPVFGRVDDVLRFPELLGPGEEISAYALTHVYSTRQGEVPFLIGSDESIRLWVNGSLVHELVSNRGRILDEDVFFAPLRRGWNTVLARVGNVFGGHSLVLRLSVEPVALARACEEAGRWEDALGHWTRAIEADPENLESRLRRGRAALRVGRLEEARRDFGKVTARHPGHSQLGIRLASLYAEHGHVEEAVAVLAAAEIETELFAAEASRLAAAGQWRATASLLRVCVQTEPQLTLDWHYKSFYLAILLVYIGEAEEHQALCRRMLEVFRGNTNVQIAERMSKMCLFSGTFRDPDLVEEAARVADFASENVAEAISKNEVPAWLTPYVQHAKGIADFRRKRYESAVEALRGSVEGMTHDWAAPIRASSLFFAAMAYHHLGRTEESREQMAEAERMADALRTEQQNPDRLLMETVRREARELVAGKAANVD